MSANAGSLRLALWERHRRADPHVHAVTQVAVCRARFEARRSLQKNLPWWIDAHRNLLCRAVAARDFTSEPIHDRQLGGLKLLMCIGARCDLCSPCMWSTLFNLESHTAEESCRGQGECSRQTGRVVGLPQDRAWAHQGCRGGHWGFPSLFSCSSPAATGVSGSICRGRWYPVPLLGEQGRAENRVPDKP